MDPSANNAARIRENLAAVRGRMAAAAARSGRTDEMVRLVGVTKYLDAPTARLLALAGLTDLGESRPQELWAKASALADVSPTWHLVGHLQTNKVRRTLQVCSLIHSADSLRLVEAISREACLLKISAEVLLEVNISGDATKTGMNPGEVEPLLPRIAELKGVVVRGLMAMASREGDLAVARREFAAVRNLRNQLAANSPAQCSFAELSMGMSGDYEVAIEEGATIVRLGSALVEGLADAAASAEGPHNLPGRER